MVRLGWVDENRPRDNSGIIHRKINGNGEKFDLLYLIKC